MNDFNDIISTNEYYIGMPDCIAGGADYEDDIQNAFNLTNGLLRFDGLTSKDTEEQFEIELIVNGNVIEFSVKRMSDYIDSEGLIKGLNEVLDSTDYDGAKRFCDINGVVADVGVAFITEEQERKLALSGLIWREG